MMVAMLESNYHETVLKEEILSYLHQTMQSVNISEENSSSVFILDGTLGDAGHSFLFLEHYPQAILWTTDRDPQMCLRAMERFKKLGIEALYISDLESEIDKEKIRKAQVIIWNCNFSNLPNLVRLYANRKVNFILLDLGVASYHFLQAKRGFSFQDESLDMRLDHSALYTAKEIINTFPSDQLARIFSEWGEQRYAKTIAQVIVKSRPISTAQELAKIVSRVIYGKQSLKNTPKTKKRKIHPATHVFQALRIYINKELDYIQKVLQELPMLLKEKGCLAVISFHSLEDRIVKRSFLEWGISLKRYEKFMNYKKENRKSYAKNKIDPQKSFIILNPKPIKASEEEIQKNPSARSSLLRVLQKRELELK